MMEKHEGFKNLMYIFMKNNPNKRKSKVADRFMSIKSYYLSLDQAGRTKKKQKRNFLL